MNGGLDEWVKHMCSTQETRVQVCIIFRIR